MESLPLSVRRKPLGAAVASPVGRCPVRPRALRRVIVVGWSLLPVRLLTSAFVRHRGRISRPAFCWRALVPLILIALALVLVLIALALVLIALVLIAFPPELKTR